MPALAGAAKGASNQLAVADHARPHTSRHRQKDKIRNTPPGPESRFGEHRRIRITLDPSGDTESLCQDGAHRHIAPVWKIGRVDDAAPLWIDGARQRNTDSLEGIARPDAGFRQQLPRLPDDRLHVDAPILGNIHRAPNGFSGRAVLIGHGQDPLRAPDVDP